MTVTTKQRRHRFEPGSALAVEAIPFPYLSPDSIRVYELGGGFFPDVLLARDIDYALGGDGVTKSGTVRPLRSFMAGIWIEVRRVTAIEQLARIKPHEPLPAEAMERQLDRMAMVAAEQGEDLGELGSRAILVPPGGNPGSFRPDESGVLAIYRGNVSLQPLMNVLPAITDLYDDGPWDAAGTLNNDGVWG